MKRLLACALLACGAAGARELPLWEAGVVTGTLSGPAYSGAATRSSRVLVLPFLIYRGPIFRSDAGGLGARLINNDWLEFDLGVSAALPGRAAETPARRGMPGLGPQIELGPRARITLARPTPASRVRLDLPLRRVFEVRAGLHQRGWVADPRLVWETSDEARHWGFYTDVGATFGDAANNRHFYEVAPQYATPERPAYVARAGLISTRVGASLWWRMNDTARLYAFAREESYAHSANRASPLFEATSGLSVGLGLAWTLGRSSEPAP